MTPAGAAAILPAKGSALHIFGLNISWDALLIAGASLVGIIFLYKVGQPSGGFAPSSTVDPSGGGADASSLSTVPAATPMQAFSSYGGSQMLSQGAVLTNPSSGGGGGAGTGGVTPAPTQPIPTPRLPGAAAPSGGGGGGSIGGASQLAASALSRIGGGSQLGFAALNAAPPTVVGAPRPSGFATGTLARQVG